MYLYGASGHSKVILEIAELLSIPIKGLIDDNTAIQQLLDYPVIHEMPHDIKELFISIGNNRIRKDLHERYSNCLFPTLIHPSANLTTRITIGHGCVIMAGATINSSVSIGNQTIINTNASIDHDCTLEDYVHISPNAALAGNVKIGEGTHIGIGACVIPGIKIGKWCTIGAGTVIIRDIPDFCTVVGNPGKIIKQLK